MNDRSALLLLSVTGLVCCVANDHATAAADLIVDAQVLSVSGPRPSVYCNNSASDLCGEYELQLANVNSLKGKPRPDARFYALYVIDDNGHVWSGFPPPRLFSAETQMRLHFEHSARVKATYELVRISRPSSKFRY